jgi:DNA polymerase-3 subunit alpha
VAEQIFSEMVSFAKYAFNKSHAAAYAVLSFRSAYLKCHYPTEYFAALLNSVLGNTPKVAEYLADAAKMGIAVLPPDVSQSEAGCTPVAGQCAIRFGLSAIRNLGDRFAAQIVTERQNGAYTSFEDFLTRLSHSDRNRKNLEMLIKSGALDCFGVPRSVLYASYEEMLTLSGAGQSGQIEGQMDLFSSLSAEEAGQSLSWQYDYPELAEWTRKEKLLFERESLGLSFSGHLLDDYAAHIEQLEPTELSAIVRGVVGEEAGEDAQGFCDRDNVLVCGIVTRLVPKTTKKGEQMLFFTLEDRYAQLEVVVFAQARARYAALLLQDSAIAVHGTLSVREDEVKLLLKEAQPLLHADKLKGKDTPQKSATLFLRLPSQTDARIPQIKRFLEGARGQTAVRFYYADRKEYSPTVAYTGLNAQRLDDLRALLGVQNVALQEKKDKSTNH